MRKLQWDSDAWDEYIYWQTQDRRTLRQVNQLIRDAMRSPYEGIGKPEPLIGNLSGFWSRRIDERHRLVYAVEEDVLLIVSCRGHYED